MKKANTLLWIFLMLSITSQAGSTKKDTKRPLTKWLQAGPISLHYPAFHQKEDPTNKTFKAKNLLQAGHLDLKKLTPSENEPLLWNSTTHKWKGIQANRKEFVGQENTQGEQLNYYVCYLTPEKYVKTNINIQAYPMIEVYLDGKKVASKYTEETKKPGDLKTDFTLEPRKHTLLVKTLSTKGKNQFKAQISPIELEVSLSPKHFITINNVLDGKKVKGCSISPNGKWVLLSFSRTLPPSDKSESWKEVQEIETGKIIHSFRGSNLGQIQWVPEGNSLSYTRTLNKETAIYQLDLTKGTESLLTEHLKDFGYYSWAPNAKTLIYTRYKDYKEDWKIRKIQGIEDRLPGFRNRSNLFMIDIQSGIRQQLTHGALSSNLHDISPDGKSILFSQSWPDYNEYPYDKQNLYQMNLETFQLDTIWKNKRFGGQAQFSPDGKKLLVQGGPSCFGELGEKKGDQPLANNYDGQLYILDLATKKVDPITYNFDPAIGQAVWNKADGKIYLQANDKDFVRLFRYDPSKKEFTMISTGVDVIKNLDLATQNQRLVYTGCSISTPYQAYVLDLKMDEFKVISAPEKENLKDVVFGKTEDWNFTNKEGKTIIGRVYYPPNFDSNKKYPLIVNYYAGTSPVERSFGGRYPLNHYAANGYVVYLLQPSGAIGFGQEFSAAHQNNWGKTTAQEIIKGTKEFLKTHSFVDPKRVGCIGASYGGFMTMYLQTQTDIFAAAISHAGISSIASYWGEGYWGYSYSVNASGLSFPWNNRDLYINRSPLFNADKIHTPMLLIHGSVDTNVPLGESIQMYQALKLLGRDAEFVQVKNQNHHILNYTQRILWNNTIFAYFAKYLKNQPQWWNDLYPDKKLF